MKLQRASRKEIRRIALGTLVCDGIMIAGLFLLSQFVLDIQALFSRNLAWKQIPHTGRRDPH